MAAAAAAAAIIRKERDMVAHFRQHNALSPATAKTMTELGVHPEFVWTRLVRRAVIRESAPGLYYFDEPSWNARNATRRRAALIALIVVLALFAATMLPVIMMAR
ncbi:MAG TPA: hypothetical protein VHV78_07105 [Gemmatimonadaceae bacterium]|jgi:hypothetical protein|nr:hypothetical protein [Gemmatimonadaceae bacterium]